MKFSYPAVIHHEDDSYWAEFPDLEGCHTFADTLDGIFNEAKEALCAYCSALVGEEKVLPVASDISSIERGNDGDILTVIEISTAR